MTGVSNTFSSLWKIITSPFDSKEYEDESMFEDMESLAGEYPVDGVTALEPMYPSQQKSRDNVVSHPAFKGYEVMVHEPRSFEESISIVQYLKDKRTVILNLHLLDKEQSQRIVDFLCGATYAINGHQQKIGDAVFIFTPSNVNLTAEVQKSKTLYSEALWNKQQ